MDASRTRTRTQVSAFLYRPTLHPSGSSSFVYSSRFCPSSSFLTPASHTSFLHTQKCIPPSSTYHKTTTPFTGPRMSTQAKDATTNTDTTATTNSPTHFIYNIIQQDIKSGKLSKVVTRFPPEPNGYLHLGHSKSICLNFTMAQHFRGETFMRLDDTNPIKEDIEFTNAILEDVQWLGFQWSSPDHLRHASDYYEQLYNFAVRLIEKGLAYVDELSAEEIRKYRGTLTQPGKESPFRDRSIEENLALFEKMRDGQFAEGKAVLRAKIDMNSGNINMRDPTLYRIRHVPHPRTGNKWCIYPLYDYAHCISDALEGITHSLCTLEFEDHRPLYDWVLAQFLDDFPRPPQQIEFSRLNLQYTVLSKRKLIKLIKEKIVHGWDDPRMPTIRGVRRRGYPPQALRVFCERLGVSKQESNIDISVLEDCVRENLDAEAPRAFAVVNPIKLTITNWPSEDHVEYFTAPRHPKKPEYGERTIPFTGTVYIDQSDFADPPPPKYFRLSPGKRVRLKFAYVVECQEVIKDEQGNVVELKCSYFPDTKSGHTPEGMQKVKGIIQWVSATMGVPAEIRIYDRLFNSPSPGTSNTESQADAPTQQGEDEDEKDAYLNDINPDSLKIERGFVEPSIKDAPMDTKFQFERVGYFTLDAIDSKPDAIVFNRIVTLRDTWSKIQGQ